MRSASVSSRPAVRVSVRRTIFVAPQVVELRELRARAAMFSGVARV